MEEKLKLKNVQVVLFFRNEVEYNSLELANNIVKGIPQIGQPNIFNLPKDVPNEIRMQAPRIVFNNMNGLNINITALSLNINMMSQLSNEEIKNNVSKLYDALIEQGIQVQSLGMVCDYFDSSIDFENIKQTFYKDEILTSDLVNCSWYKKEEELNIWKVLNMSEENSHKELNLRIDINNRNNKNTMSKNAVEDMVKKCYEKIVKFKKEIINKIGE